MPHLHIRITNSHLDVRDEGRDYPSIETASQAAVSAATEAAQEIIKKGVDEASLEVRLEDGDRTIFRRAVTLTVSELDAER
jgi:pectin methylesterase-like acyl-CoA thioesterase